MEVSVNQLLFEGTYDGLRCYVYNNWNSGELYISPRESIDKLLSRDASKRYGVYLLLSEDKVYVGQAMDLANRVKNHVINKDWWTEVVMLTTSDDSLNHADIDYLEYHLIEKAKKNNQLDSENKQKGHKPKVDMFHEPKLKAYLKGALFALEGAGITVFKEFAPTSQISVSTGEERFYFKANGSTPRRHIDAQMDVKDGKFILLKGSVVAMVPTTSCNSSIRNTRESYKDMIGDDGVLQEDIECKSVSGAGAIANYGNLNGKISWKTFNGVTYQDWLAAQAP